MDGDDLRLGLEVATRRARWARGLLAACVAASVAGIGLDLSMLDFLERARTGFDVTEAEAQALDARESGLAWLSVALLVISAVVWCRWLHRAYANLRLAGSRTTRFTPGWAVGWWFVPIVNIIRTLQVMQELVARSADGNAGAAARAGSPWLVNIWWLLLMAWRIVDRIAGRTLARAEGLDEMARGYRYFVAAESIAIACGVLAWLLVRRVERLQQQELVGSVPAATPLPA